MKLSKMAWLAAVCAGTCGWSSTSLGQESRIRSIHPEIALVSHCDCGGDPGCDSCGGGCDAVGCDSGICDTGTCDSGRPHRLGNLFSGAGCDCGDSACGGGCGDDCGGLLSSQPLQRGSLGDPFELLGGCCGWKAGGWLQMGYHNKNLSLFNSRKNDFQVHQTWLYFEKTVDTTNGFDWGGRVDYVYGTDAQDTQAFGVDNNHWDNQWDNGPDYGHALPQVYGEVGYGDFTAKIGHFYTIIGHEVVTAPDNFFYSHAYTMYNSEPFSHTGALLTYSMGEDIDVFGGYALGWDSGFEDNGDAFLGGSSVQLTDDINITSTLIGGRFADKANASERGIMSSTVASIQLTQKLAYIFQTDYLDTEDAAGNTVRETFGINQYFIREFGDRFSVGARLEWWNVNASSTGFYGDNATVTDLPGDLDVYAITLGMNIRPHANIIFRPEIRWDWVDAPSAGLAAADVSLLDDLGDDDQTTFGIDTIILF